LFISFSHILTIIFNEQDKLKGLTIWTKIEQFFYSAIIFGEILAEEIFVIILATYGLADLNTEKNVIAQPETPKAVGV
jgi:hypothetical protein